MRLLALDLSTKSSGWAVFADKELIDQGCIVASSTDLYKRIHKMIDELNEIILNNSIDIVVVEEVRPDTGIVNLNTHRALMFLQAELMFLLHDKQPRIKVELVQPSSWRKNCGIKTGKGIKRDSLKQQDILFAKEQQQVNVNDDIADAICIGHSYLVSGNSKQGAW